jgi:hypothetical protein
MKTELQVIDNRLGEIETALQSVTLTFDETQALRAERESLGAAMTRLLKPVKGSKEDQSALLAELGEESFFALMKAFITDKPGLNARDYFNPEDLQLGRIKTYQNDVRNYRNAQNTLVRQRTRAMKAFNEAARHPFDVALMAGSLSYKFSGRLNLVRLDDGRIGLHYTAGQYPVMEYRHAAAVVLEDYNQQIERRITAE